MAKHEKTIYVSQTLLNMVNKYLTIEPTCREECLGEDNTISVTADFGNGMEMDIKCCGVQYREGESNTAWTEAVLFENGSEVCCTDPADDFEGEWELECDGDQYIVYVEAEAQ